MKFIYLFLVIFLFSMNGCDDNPVSATNGSLNIDFDIKFGESVYIPGENLLITFKDVVEESRCPEGVQCFSQGTAKIKLQISKGNEQIIDTVETFLPQSILSIGQINNSYLFWVKNVKPYPKQNVEIVKRNYVLTLNVAHFTYGFPDSLLNNKTGLFGQVFIFPIAPHGMIGYLNYRPFQTSIKFVDEGNDTTNVQTDSTGRFIAYLQAGEYHIAPTNRLSSRGNYTVAEGKMNYVIVYYDSGIR